MSALEIPGDLNITRYFLESNVDAGRGQRTALSTSQGALTYDDLVTLTNRAGNVLRGLGVGPGDRVLLALADSAEFVAAWFAAQKIGAVTAEVYTFLQAKDYAYYLEYTQARVVVVDTPTLARMREAVVLSGGNHTLLVAGARDVDLRDREASLEQRMEGADDRLEPAPTLSDDIAIWKFTTGSTGRPKACVHTARSPVVNYHGYAKGVLDLRETDVVLPVPKLFFGYARDLAALYPFGVGAAGVIFAERSTPQLLFDLIARHQPTILVNVPTMMQAMLDHPDAAANDLSCLRLCTSAGEALAEPLQRRWMDTFGVEVLDGIGSSEAYHIYISNRPGRVRPGSMGEAVPGYRAQVMDEDGRELHDGGIGRLWVRGDSAGLMYWGDEERSATTFGDALVMSGDLAERDADGYFWYRGRADDLLKIGGIFVAPAEMERCIATHPDVAECAVVGVERDGLVASRAYIVLRNAARLTAEDLQTYVRERLSPHKSPREVVLVAELPKTGSGKVDRATLRESAAAVSS